MTNVQFLAVTVNNKVANTKLEPCLAPNKNQTNWILWNIMSEGKLYILESEKSIDIKAKQGSKQGNRRFSVSG